MLFKAEGHLLDHQVGETVHLSERRQQRARIKKGLVGIFLYSQYLSIGL